MVSPYGSKIHRPIEARAATRPIWPEVACLDVPGISRVSRWSGAPAIETSVISRLVRLQQASRSDSGSCGGDTVGVQVPPFALPAPQRREFPRLRDGDAVRRE